MHLLPLRPPSVHEDLFLDHYPSLVRWALQLCGGDRGLSEDLVHDAFIQFTLVRPDLTTIRDLEGYLHGMVRRMHASHVRRAARVDRRTTSFLEWDSVELGLRAVDVFAGVEARVELETICRYACGRKESSKAGSILILRFFHGYFPSEIALLARVAPRVADEWLRIARREARLYGEHPERLGFLSTTPSLEPAPLSVAAASSPEMLVDGLRCLIFSSRQGPCLTPKRLRELYGDGAPAMPCTTLAHIVSCRTCLQLVNEHLDIERLDQRYPTDMLGPNAGGSGTGSRQALSRGDARRRDRRRRATYEHRAEEVQVAINGFVLSAVTVGQAITRQRLAINLSEPIGFVEVFADRHTRLLFVAVETPPDGPIEHSARVILSEARSLDVHLSFAGVWPELRLVYRDPAFAADALPHPGAIERPVPLTAAHQESPVPDHRRSASPLAGLFARLARRRANTRWTARRFRPAWALMMLVLLASATLLQHDAVFAAVRAAARAVQHLVGTITQERFRHQPLPAPVVVPGPLAPAVAEPPPVPVTSPPDRRSARPETHPVDLAALEIQVLERLDRADALLGEQITIARTGVGRLRLTGIVDTASRKAELRSILAPLARTGVLRLDLETVTEAVARGEAKPRGPTITRRFEFDARLPLEDVLARYVAERRAASNPGSTPDPAVVRSEVLQLADGVLARSRQALLHAFALGRLAEVADLERVRSTKSGVFETWSAMVRKHATRVGLETQALRGLLDPILFAAESKGGEPATAAADPRLPREAEMHSLIQGLVAGVTAQDAAVRASFAASTEVLLAKTVTTPAFRDLLLRIERDAWVLARE